MQGQIVNTKYLRFDTERKKGKANGERMEGGGGVAVMQANWCMESGGRVGYLGVYCLGKKGKSPKKIL